MCVDDKFSKPFKSYLCEDAVNYFINSILKESKYCSDVMKNYFNKELVMTKKDDKHFENCTKSWICFNHYVDSSITIRDHCHITGKYRGSAFRDFNIKVKLYHKISILFHNLMHLIIQ